jgi:hypothetical protein
MFSNTSLSHFLYLLHLVAPMPRNHNPLGAAAPVPTRTTQCPAVELIEFFQRYNAPDSTKPSALKTENFPFLGSLLTRLAAAGKR